MVSNAVKIMGCWHGVSASVVKKFSPLSTNSRAGGAPAWRARKPPAGQKGVPVLPSRAYAALGLKRVPGSRREMLEASRGRCHGRRLAGDVISSDSARGHRRQGVLRGRGCRSGARSGPRRRDVSAAVFLLRRVPPERVHVAGGRHGMLAVACMQARTHARTHAHTHTCMHAWDAAERTGLLEQVCSLFLSLSALI
jgi:hypothetical protein